MTKIVRDVVIVEIMAMHSFDTVVARRVFVDQTSPECEYWVSKTKLDLMTDAVSKDPSFHFYSFEPRYISTVFEEGC